MPTVIEVSPMALTIIMALFGALLTFLATLFWKYREESRARQKENEAKIVKLTGEMMLLQSQFSPFWAAVQTRITSDLTHPHERFAEMDALLVKLENFTLTDDEKLRLEDLLRMRAVTDDPGVSQSERDSAALMIVVMRQTVREAGRINDGDTPVPFTLVVPPPVKNER